ncbi:MAG TPA: 4-hydroxy-2-oxoheptanedioate aldolase [Alphaproteobacteria bacterium]|jgi:4-hydroxy-2-oxoheptanedioate aldolase
MDLPINGFKRALGGGRPQFGLWLSLADPYCAELCAGAGFDWLLIDAEHSPNDLRSILAQLQAVAPYPVHPIVRPPFGDTVTIKRLLDIGVQTLLIPMVETAEQAAALVAAMRYPPNGVRGVGSLSARASRFNRVPNYLQKAEAELCLIVQVESKRALDNIEEIAATPGVDAVFVGPSDLSAALGHLGNPNHPEVHAAIEDAVKRIRAAGRAAGIMTPDETMARRALAYGCNFVAVGADAAILARGTEALAKKFKDGA